MVECCASCPVHKETSPFKWKDTVKPLGLIRSYPPRTAHSFSIILIWSLLLLEFTALCLAQANIPPIQCLLLVSHASLCLNLPVSLCAEPQADWGIFGFGAFGTSFFLISNLDQLLDLEENASR